MVLRPNPSSYLFWGIAFAALAAGGLYMRAERLESKKSADEWATWEKRLNTLVDVNDVNDDGHLYEWLDPPQWEAVFAELERMPKGVRSLRKAMSAVSPDVLDND